MRLRVCEGLDGAGKTTTIEQLLQNKRNNDLIYSKGIGSNTWLGKLARKFPSTFLFLLELLYIQYKVIKPNLKKGKTVLQDRYDFSIITYPTAQRFYNKIITKILSPLIPEPDSLIHFHVDVNERIKRLKGDNNKYHKILSENPNLIILRERRYLHLYNQFSKSKIKIDTTNKSIKQSAKILENFIKSH